MCEWVNSAKEELERWGSTTNTVTSETTLNNSNKQKKSEILTKKLQKIKVRIHTYLFFISNIFFELN